MVAATATYLSFTNYDVYSHETQFHRRIRAVSSSPSYNDVNNNRPTFYWLIDLQDPELVTCLFQTTLCGSSASSSSGWTERILSNSSPDDGDDEHSLVYLGTCGERNNKPSQSTVFEYSDDTLRVSAMAEPSEYPFATDFMARVDALRPTGQSVLFANTESALFTTGQIRQMQELLTSTWDVQILLVHRPLEEWLLLFHHHQQQQQQQPQQIMTHSNVFPFLDLEHSELPSTQSFLQAEQQSIHPVQILQRRYQSQFPKVNLVSLSDLYLAHNTNDSPSQRKADETALLWEYVVCDFVHEASPMCEHMHRSETLESFLNQQYQPRDASSFSGPLGNRVLEAQQNDETLICPSPNILERLERVAMLVDRSVHGSDDQWTQAHATFYQSRFQEWVASKRYCHSEQYKVISTTSATLCESSSLTIHIT